MSSSGENSLKTKAFFITCPYCHGISQIGIINSNLAAKEHLQNMGVEISKENTFAGIEKEIVEPSYHGYASLLFFIELECFHCSVSYLLKFAYAAIERNSTLKYVTKLLISYSYIEKTFSDECDTVFLNDGKIKATFKNPTIEEMTELFPNSNVEQYPNMFKVPSRRRLYVDIPKYRKNYLDTLRKLIRRDVPVIDNLIVVECVELGAARSDTVLESFFRNLIALAKTNSVQEIAQQTIATCDDLDIHNEVATYTATGNGECYIYNVNPALAIVINHQSFASHLHLSFRDGSLNDVRALQRAFKSKKIPSLTLNDGSQEDVQAIMRKVRTTNFTGIKNLFIVIMSHGDEGDIIYTKTDSYSIRDDIVAPILANHTLALVQKFVIVNACRGNVDPRFDDIEDVEKIRSSLSENSSMYPCDNKLMMVFSTQKGFISLLFDQGSIFVQCFCDIFLKNFDEKSMETISEELQELMMEYIADDQIPDFGITDGQNHSIKMEFVNFFNSYALFNGLAEFFKKHFKHNIGKLNSNLNKMLHEKSLFTEEHDRTLLGIGYVDGVSKLTNGQKQSIEQFITSKQAKLTEDNKIWSTLQVTYECSVDQNSGRYSSLAENNSIYPCDDKLIFSTQKEFISLLLDKGSMFCLCFCDIFLENVDEKSMETISEELQELMMEYIADDQIPDFGITDGQNQSIKMEFVNFFNNYALLNDLSLFFKKHLKHNLPKMPPYFFKILNAKRITIEERDRTLLGIGYVDGVSKLTIAQKKSIEQFIKAKQAKLMEGNKIWSKLKVSYEWSVDQNSGRYRVCVLKKPTKIS